jgi:penicillin-insensitive murein DD-endopeptidase
MALREALPPPAARRNQRAAWGSRPRLFGCRLLLALALAAARSPAQTLCEGRPNSGVLRGARQLPTRPYLRIKAGSESRVWGHPLLLHLISRGARAAALAAPGSVALVGDLSAPTGGPLSGHASHQAGRDADVAFFVSNASGRPVVLEAFEAFDVSGRSLEHADHVFDAYRNWLLLREWLSELRVVVTHIFVSAELRQLLLEYGRQNPEFSRYVPLAGQILHAHPTHADHFHLRIACPTDQGSECLDD